MPDGQKGRMTPEPGGLTLITQPHIIISVLAADNTSPEAYIAKRCDGEQYVRALSKESRRQVKVAEEEPAELAPEQAG